MQNNRRQFLGSLARGFLLPIGGGALTLADPAKAAGLQIMRGELPLSADALRLRSLKRDMRRCYEGQNEYASLDAYRSAWWGIRAEVNPIQRRILDRKPTSWTDVVEIAEVAWWGIAHSDQQRSNDPSSTLAKAVLTLGGGERFYLHDEAPFMP